MGNVAYKNMVSGIWKNPYVDADISMMLDGEWNAGRGIHNDNAAFWTDIIGNRVFTGKSPLFERDCAVIKGMNNTYDHFLDPNTLSMFESQDHTIEICIGEQLSLANEQGLFCIGDDGTGKFWEYIKINTAANHALGVHVRGMSMTPHQFAKDKSTYTISVKGNKFDMFQNGVIQEKDKPTFDCNRAFSNVFRLGYYTKWDGNWSMWGRIHCVRLYGRALSEDEIVHNYEIDRKRFGI